MLTDVKDNCMMARPCRNTSTISLANDSALAFAEEADKLFVEIFKLTFEVLINCMMARPFVEIFKLTFEVLIALFRVIGSVFVVIVISKLRKKKQPTDFYVQHLAIADLGTLKLTFSFGVIKEKAPFNWPFGVFACRY